MHMLKKNITILLGLVVLLAGAFFVWRQISDGGSGATDNSSSKASDTGIKVAETWGSPDSNQAEVAQKGQYVTYGPTVISETKGKKILFFHAPWCAQCRALDADIKDTGLPVDVTVIKVDYDSSQDLRKKYGVTLQTTLVLVDDEGALVKKYVAYDQPTVAALKQNLL
jgi:thiol-disulfide isomerase/thioredoxin